MGRWSQFNEDSTRLPVGIARIAYDTDTTRYMFQDTHGRRYIGAPGEEYGVMVPITAADALAPLGSKVPGKRAAKPAYDRPAVFAGDAPAGSPLDSEFSSDDDNDVAAIPPPPVRRAHGHTRSPSAPSTFADILPPSLIAPAPPPPPPSSSHLPPSPFRTGKSRRAASTGDTDADATPARRAREGTHVGLAPPVHAHPEQGHRPHVDRRPPPPRGARQEGGVQALGRGGREERLVSVRVGPRRSGPRSG